MTDEKFSECQKELERAIIAAFDEVAEARGPIDVWDRAMGADERTRAAAVGGARCERAPNTAEDRLLNVTNYVDTRKGASHG